MQTTPGRSQLDLQLEGAGGCDSGKPVEVCSDAVPAEAFCANAIGSPRISNSACGLLRRVRSRFEGETTWVSSPMSENVAHVRVQFTLLIEERYFTRKVPLRRLLPCSARALTPGAIERITHNILPRSAGTSLATQDWYGTLQHLRSSHLLHLRYGRRATSGLNECSRGGNGDTCRCAAGSDHRRCHRQQSNAQFPNVL